MPYNTISWKVTKPVSTARTGENFDKKVDLDRPLKTKRKSATIKVLGLCYHQTQETITAPITLRKILSATKSICRKTGYKKLGDHVLLDDIKRTKNGYVVELGS